MDRTKILYVDDEPNNLETFKLVFSRDYEVITFQEPLKALPFLEAQLGDENPVKTIISDQKMPEMNGLEFLEKAIEINPSVPTIILTGYSSQDLLMKAINKLHIYSFADKPWQYETLKNQIDNAIKHYELVSENQQLLHDVSHKNKVLTKALNEINELKTQLEAENSYLREEIRTNPSAAGIITEDKGFLQVLNATNKVAKADTTVLIFGETGTGKELVARAIHDLSPRNKKPLIKVNCAAMPASLIESELFGHEKGAFSGAIKLKVGRFELANGGTLFLDEIGEMPLELQSKLLRVLQEGEFERVGGIKTIKTDFRLISATNRDLQKQVDAGKFRADLYYRLSVVPIAIPPLRMRKGDIKHLVEHFIEKYNQKIGKNITKISTKALEQLEAYDWPGNVRELENIVERAIITASGHTLKIDQAWLGKKGKATAESFPSLDHHEKQLIVKALEHTGGVINGEGGAASLLNINPSTLRSRIQKHGIKIAKGVQSV